VDLLDPPQTVEIPIEQVSRLKPGTALAIARSDPGDNLDLTRNTPIWAMVEFADPTADRTTAPSERSAQRSPQIIIQGGEGIGRHANNDQAAIYGYARRLLRENLTPLLASTDKITVTIILPEGRQLAQRTSNEAFGVVQGLSLLGTTGISEPLSSPGQLEAYRQELAIKARQFDSLVFCIGENGLDLAAKMGIDSGRLVKMANWIGPLLVAASEENVKSILLFGYHGKLMKLAGGIFHTHHYLADGRREILAAHCGNLGLPTVTLQQIFASETAEAALQVLRDLDISTNSDWVDRVYGAIAARIDMRSQDYIRIHSNRELQVGCLLFDRRRQIIIKSKRGDALLPKLC
jgi:cobalt-precorrin-5B (C1)-methyltransferase